MNEAAQAEAPETLGTVVWRRLTGADSPWPWLAVLFLAVVSHVAVLGNSFNFDDWKGFESSYLTHPHAIWLFFTGDIWQFAGKLGLSPYYRPVLMTVGYWLFRAFGWNPMPFHAFSVILHALASLLVLPTVRRFSGSHAVGVVAALLFAVHPASSEVIAWAGANQEPMCVIFTLLALLSYAYSVESAGRRRLVLLVALGINTLLAELTKEIAIFIPLFAVSYEWFVERRGIGRQLRERWREYAAMAVVTVAYFVARFLALGGFKVVRAKTGVPMGVQIWTAVSVFYRYVKLAVWPVNFNTIAAHPLNLHAWEPAVLAGFFSIAAVPALSIWLYRKRRPEILGIPIYVLPLLPLLQIPYLINGIVMTDRAVYLPLVGFCWLAAAAVVAARKFVSRECVAAVVVIVLISYSARSALRMYEWRDECQLCEEGVVLNPTAPFVRLFLAETLLRHDRPMEAIVNLREALRLSPSASERGGVAPAGEIEVHNLLGRAYLRLRQPETAIREYLMSAEIAVQLDTPAAASRAWNNAGIAYRSIGRLDEAAAAYRRSLELDSEFTGARNNLGFVLLLQGRVPDAIAELEETIRQDPGLPPAYANLGLAYATAGRLGDARTALATAERVAPDSAEVHARIGELELVSGRPQEALGRFERALKLEPGNERAQKGMAALQNGR